MFSGVIAWFYRALLGLSPMEAAPGFERLELRPVFLPALSHAEGFIDTVRGRIAAKWVRTDAGFDYTVTVPPTVTATFDGQRLVPGENLFHVKN
jgi:alpha-L-rhamnosidase